MQNQDLDAIKREQKIQNKLTLDFELEMSKTFRNPWPDLKSR